jgi:predicted lipoprotein with Yx(FWY)xxD motif
MGRKKQQRALLRRSAAAAADADADADAGTTTRRTTATTTGEFDTDHGDHSNCRPTCDFNFPPGWCVPY